MAPLYASAVVAILAVSATPALAGRNGKTLDAFQAVAAHDIVKQVSGVTTEAGNGRGGENHKGF
jgi:hypothetical protein